MKLSLTSPEVLVEDDFILHLFQIIEGLSDDVSDPYHYPTIRVLVRCLSLPLFPFSLPSPAPIKH